MQRVVTLPAIHRTVTLGAYVKAVKMARDNPDAEFDHGLTTWWPTKGREIVEQFRHGMNDRINQGIPYSKRGMKP